MSRRKATTHSSFDRREFLKVGSIAAVGFALPAGILQAASANPLPILSVGYSRVIPQEKGQYVRLSAARDLLAGDPFFISQGARIRIGTFVRSPWFVDRKGAVDLEVVYPSYGFQPEDYPRFQAWRFRHAGGQQSTSQTVSLTVPVTSTGGLQMVFREPQGSRGRAAKSTAAEGAVAAGASVLTLDPGVGSNVLKLQTGAYVVALREDDNEREPDWDGQILARGTHGLNLNSAATFTYLILTIDYAV